MNRPRITYANVASTIALVAALGGGAAYAAEKIGAGDLKDEAVTEKKVADKAITPEKLSKQAVTPKKLAADSVKTAKLAPGAVDASRLGAGAVGTDTVLDEAITHGKLAPDSVTGNRIASGAVGSREMAFPVRMAGRPQGGTEAIVAADDVSYPLANSSWTQEPGEVVLLAGEVTITLQDCGLDLRIFVDGDEYAFLPRAGRARPPSLGGSWFRCSIRVRRRLTP